MRKDLASIAKLWVEDVNRFLGMTGTCRVHGTATTRKLGEYRRRLLSWRVAQQLSMRRLNRDRCPHTEIRQRWGSVKFYPLLDCIHGSRGVFLGFVLGLCVGPWYDNHFVRAHAFSMLLAMTLDTDHMK